jgi:Protein of unknown function (DUF2946)
MRRQIGKFLPIVAIAVLVQLFAPIAASWSMSASLDPLSAVPICSSLHEEAGSSQQPSDHQPTVQDCCSICFVAHNTALADDPSNAVAIPQSYASVISWSDHAFHLAFARYDSAAQARAPPKKS